ncbi:MAG: hypothetical protein IJD22_00805 [Clostridia bacterium]|nr:hypothetical protein [Clostridia bacterium]
MKRIVALVLAVLAVLLCGCREKKEERTARELSHRVQIVTERGGIEEQTAALVGEMLMAKGYEVSICLAGEGDMKKEEKGFCATVAVGCSVKEAEGAYLECSFDITEKGSETLVAPGLSSGRMARAALLLMPEAESFSIISEKAGGADVQDACDVLDMSGVSYTVETVEGKPYGDAVAKAAEGSCDALILPSEKLWSAAADLSEYETAIIAVGSGEPLRGALASFCIDGEKMAYEVASRVTALVEGEEAEPLRGGCYVLCVNLSIARELGADVEAASEDFSVVITE